MTEQLEIAHREIAEAYNLLDTLTQQAESLSAQISVAASELNAVLARVCETEHAVMLMAQKATGEASEAQAAANAAGMSLRHAAAAQHGVQVALCDERGLFGS